MKGKVKAAGKEVKPEVKPFEKPEKQGVKPPKLPSYCDDIRGK